MKQNGFSLIELMVTITVFAVLVSVALPAFEESMAVARVKSTAEVFNRGLQLARSEAIKQNSRVYFSYSTTGWEVGCVTASVDCPIQSKPATEGSRLVNITATPADANKVTFTSLGRLYVDSAGVLNNPDGTAEFEQLRFSSVSTTSLFDVLIRSSGQVKLCKPDAISGSVMGC